MQKFDLCDIAPPRIHRALHFISPTECQKSLAALASLSWLIPVSPDYRAEIKTNAHVVAVVKQFLVPIHDSLCMTDVSIPDWRAGSSISNCSLRVSLSMWECGGEAQCAMSDESEL